MRVIAKSAVVHRNDTYNFLNLGKGRSELAADIYAYILAGTTGKTERGYD